MMLTVQAADTYTCIALVGLLQPGLGRVELLLQFYTIKFPLVGIWYYTLSLLWNQLNYRAWWMSESQLRRAIYHVFTLIRRSIAFKQDISGPLQCKWMNRPTVPCGNVNPASGFTECKWHFTLTGWLLYITETNWPQTKATAARIKSVQTNRETAHSQRAKIRPLPFTSPWKQSTTWSSLSSLSAPHSADCMVSVCMLIFRTFLAS